MRAACNGAPHQGRREDRDLKILYGIQTTGHGHLVRATPIVQGLRALGHEVHVLLSGPAVDPSWLARIGEPLVAHPGLTFVTEGGRIRHFKTVVRARPLRFLRDVMTLRSDDFDMVVTDYEPITAWNARKNGIRSIGIGHQYAFTAASVPRAAGSPLASLVMDIFAPVSIPVGTHWHPFGAPLVPPTVAPEIRSLARPQTPDDLVLVYTAFEPLADVIPHLDAVTECRFRVYSKTSYPVTRPHVEIHPISRNDFIADLARCRGVIANAGFTLTTECLHLGIPLMSKPLTGQIEQESNAVALEKLGLATVTRRLRADEIRHWLATPPPPPAGYPDVSLALVDWLHGGAREPVAALSARLWRGVTLPH